jgi:hypothetical protein
MNWKTILLPSAYLALFALCAFAIVWWERRKRGARVPFALDFRLLRVAGEEPLKEVTKMDGDVSRIALWAGVVPCLVAVLLLAAVSGLGAWQMWAAVGITLAAFTAGLVLAVRWFLIQLRDRVERHLGYFGERVVAECLEPMKGRGWRVFYDVPCEIGKERFNIDHVTVGPGGVYAIETRTQRRNGARDGRDDYKVFYDGEQLNWPWGEDQRGTDEALRNAQWLQQWLEKTTGQKIGVVPVLALPGWYVEAKAKAAVRVVSPSWLPDMLAGSAEVILNEKQVELCIRQLEQRCRDVAY